uniref:Pleckstrin homology domain containing B1 n=1 Tax=Scleropages formosus TaxID=113540 RepID=A0A8C9VWD5_SCLFO
FNFEPLGDKWRKICSILKRWKLNWCDLWVDGNLVFYKTDSRKDYENRVSLKNQCVNVKSGLECTGVVPPEGHPKESLLVVVLKDGSTMAMCANSEDEALAWKLTLMEAKRNPVSLNMDEAMLTHFLPISCFATGTHHILVHRDPYDGIGEQVALGLLAGMAAGAAMRSFLWMPFWFC